MSCKDCTFLGPAAKDDWESETPKPTCRRRSPLATGGMMSAERTIWPIVDPETDWCGEFQNANP